MMKMVKEMSLVQRTKPSKASRIQEMEDLVAMRSYDQICVNKRI